MNWGKQRGLILILLLWLLSGCQNATETVVPLVDEVTEVAIAEKATKIATATATKMPPSPTITKKPTITIEPTKTHTPTEVPATEVLPTEVPPTEVPPTEVPATEVPPTEVPATEVPAIEVLPTEVPATEVLATEVSPTEVLPTEIVPTEVPATEVPATEVLATEVLATEVPVTEVPPTEVPATEVPATEVPATEVLATEVPATQVPATFVPTIEIMPTEVPATVIPATQVPPTPAPPVISSSATGTQPVLLMIPRLGVNAGIESVGQTASGAMDVPHNVQSVGWYNLGVRPGEMGNAVLSGHFDDYKQDPAVFWRLHELVIGDVVMVRDAQGREHQYEVIGQEIYPFNQAPLNRIFGLSTSHNLNLITCNGTWDENAWNYDKRLVVYTRQIKY